MADYIAHHGIKGMKWGVRRFQNKDGTRTPAGKKRENMVVKRVTTKKGHEMLIKQNEASIVARILSKHSAKIRSTVERSFSYTLLNVDKKKVGEMELFAESKDELNGTWLGVNKKERGKGYAEAALKEAINYAKDNGYKKFTLEVPGNSPDARHIYEKNGFKVTKTITDSDDVVWGGLTAMELDLRKDQK